MPRPALYPALFCLLTGCLLVWGCDRQDPITSYQAPVEPRPALLVERGRATTRVPGASDEPSPITWTLPEGWREDRPAAGARLATLTAGDDRDPLTIAVTRFKGGGDLMANINRWRGQIGLEAITPDQLPEVVRSIENPRIRGILIDMAGQQRVVVAWFSDGTFAWFFKIQADPALVARHEAAFNELIKTVRLENAPDPHDHDHDHTH